MTPTHPLLTQAKIRAEIASAAEVKPSAVSVTYLAASIKVIALIVTPAGTSDAAVRAGVSASLGTAAQVHYCTSLLLTTLLRITLLLYYSTTLLLYCSTTLLLYCSTAILLYYSTTLLLTTLLLTILLLYCSTTLLLDYSPTLLLYCSTTLLLWA